MDNDQKDCLSIFHCNFPLSLSVFVLSQGGRNVSFHFLRPEVRVLSMIPISSPFMTMKLFLRQVKLL